MVQRHSIVTVVGRNKEAAKTAVNQPMVFTEIALGSGDRYPAGGETELEAEVYRAEITGSGVEAGEPNAVWFDLYVAADVATFYAQEIGLFDEDGVLYALSRFDQPVPKFGPDSTALSDNTFRIVVIFADTENIVVRLSPVAGLTSRDIRNLGRVPFIAVEAVDNPNPPAEPAQNAIWVVPANATGVWAGQTNKFAQFTGAVWTVEDAAVQTVVGSIADGKYWRRTANGWVELKATEAAAGLVQLATVAEVRDRTSAEKSVTPASLASAALWITEDEVYTIGSGTVDDFADLNEALYYLKTFLIAEGATVTLNLRAEQHVYAADIVIDHVHGRRIDIVGAALTGADPVRGDFAVTGHDAAARAADAAANLAMLRGKYNTELVLNGCSLIVAGDGLGTVDNLLITGDGTVANGIALANCAVRIGTVAIHGFGDDALYLSNADVVVFGAYSASGGAADGIESLACSSVLTTGAGDILVYGNAVCGLSISDSTSAVVRFGARGNGAYGCYITQGTLRLNGASTASDNGARGLHNIRGRFGCNGHVLTASNNASYGASCEQAVGDFRNTVAAANGYNGFYANLGSDMDVTGYAAVGNGSGVSSPALNTVGNSNSYIKG